MIRTAVITQPEVACFDWVWWPQETHWRENLEGIFNDQTAPMSVGLRNSAIIAGAKNLLLQTLFASMAGYALARLPVRGSSLVFFLILSTLMVPAGIYWRLVLPNSIGVLAALGILSFINSWNAFLWPLVIGQNPLLLDDSDRLVHVHHGPDDQPALYVHGRRRRCAAAGDRLSRHAALHRRRREVVGDQGVRRG